MSSVRPWQDPKGSVSGRGSLTWSWQLNGVEDNRLNHLTIAWQWGAESGMIPHSWACSSWSPTQWAKTEMWPGLSPFSFPTLSPSFVRNDTHRMGDTIGFGMSTPFGYPSMKFQIQPWSTRISEFMPGYLQHLDYLFSYDRVSFLCPSHEKGLPHLRSRSKYPYQCPWTAKSFRGASRIEAPWTQQEEMTLCFRRTKMGMMLFSMFYKSLNILQ